MRSRSMLMLAVVLIAGCSSDGAEPTPAPSDVPATATTVPTSTTTSRAPTTTAAPTTTVGDTQPIEPGPLIDVDDLPQGWRVLTGSDGEYSIGLPVGWKPATELIDRGELASAVSEELSDSDLDALVDMVSGMIADDQLDIAFNLAGPSLEFIENVNILSFPRSASDDVLFFEAVGRRQLESFGAVIERSEIVEVGGEDTYVVDYLAPDLGVERARQYWVAGDSLGFVVTFTGLDESDLGAWEEMMESFVAGA